MMIADGEQSIVRRIEMDVVQQRAQRVETAVQIADDEIVAGHIHGMAAEWGRSAHGFILGARAGGHDRMEWG